MKKIKLVIFDLDGTLLYTIKDIANALNYALVKNNITKVSIEDATYMIGMGVDTIVKLAIKENIDKFDSVYKDYNEYYKAHSLDYTTIYQGIPHMLKALKKANIKLAVLSNKPDSDTVCIIKNYFGDTFDIIIGQKDNMPLKPDPTVVNSIIKYFNVDKENVIFVGDSEVDIKTAKNACIKVASVLWGYRKKSELIGANYYFSNPTTLANEILSQNGLVYNGAIILDKRTGVTSQDAILEVKKALINNGYVVNKIGHAGTLDPLASGLLVVLINDATKLSDYQLNHDKEYICTCKLGIDTDSYDITGNVINESNLIVSEEIIDETLKEFMGNQKQLPPMYSAIKKDGKKLYELARANKEIEVDARDIEIYDIERLTNIDTNNCFSFRTKVSKGTYIRSLCHDLGIKLGVYATVNSLRRIASGNFKIDEAFTLEDIENNNFKLIPMLDLIDLEKVEITDKVYKKVLDGKRIASSELNATSNEVALVYNGKLVAIYKYDKEIDDLGYRAKRVWN